jgi:hypothetical protein
MRLRAVWTPDPLAGPDRALARASGQPTPLTRRRRDRVGLVEEEDGGFAAENAGEGEALALAGREGADSRRA